MSDLIHGDLNSESWNNFVERLHYHNAGEGVERHITANPLFTVQAKRRVYGIAPEYTDNFCITYDDSVWLSPQEYWDDADEDERKKIDELSDGEFLHMREDDQLEILKELEDVSVLGYYEEWEYINSHLTREAADRFIERKKHDYGLGMRVFVGSQYYAWEFNAIIKGILDKKIVFVEPPEGE